METVEKCPICNSSNTYFDGAINVCSICGHEWTPNNGGELPEE